MITQWILGHTIFRQTRPERHSTWVKIGVWTSEILPLLWMLGKSMFPCNLPCLNQTDHDRSIFFLNDLTIISTFLDEISYMIHVAASYTANISRIPPDTLWKSGVYFRKHTRRFLTWKLSRSKCVSLISGTSFNDSCPSSVPLSFALGPRNSKQYIVHVWKWCLYVPVYTPTYDHIYQPKKIIHQWIWGLFPLKCSVYLNKWDGGGSQIS